MSRRFSTVLIANRGEIACRIIRTARDEGYRTVSVYSDADEGALHTRLSDEATRIGPAPASESYLDAERLMEAAKRTGADAIHPGYGFLSENAEFAEQCAEADVVFIGPPATAIAAMGNKAQAKRLMAEAGVPCVPGYEGEDQSDEALLRAASEIGFPILLKAAAGGGGRGMRRVDDPDEFDGALRQARVEARGAFGSEELIIEKLIANARHVEIQVIADEHRNCIHLGERDCSVQRRHQKIVEESPCPVMTPKLRAAMGAAAAQAAKAVAYVNAGTVEFLLDEAGKYYFLEMNTRLQVEHPVTEMVTGLDLVALQLSVAQGEPLRLSQEDVTFRGHAIEARLYAEDPLRDFAPQAGKVLAWQLPAGTGVRIDHGLVRGSEVSPFYDPLIAKVVGWGITREEARIRLLAALRNTLVLGIRTNREFLRQITEHEQFIEGNATTAFIASSRILNHEIPPPAAKQLLIAAALYIERDAAQVPPSLKGWRSTGPANVPLKLGWNESEYPITVSMSGSQYGLTVDEDRAAIVIERIEGDTASYRLERRDERARFAFEGDDLYLESDGRVDHFVDRTYAPPATVAQGAEGAVHAPIAGQIVELHARVGDTVEAGQILAALETMKMVNHLTAPVSGVIESVSVKAGDYVEANRVLIVIADPSALEKSAS